MVLTHTQQRGKTMSNETEPFDPAEVFDSRDVIARINYLDAQDSLSEEEREEITRLRAFADEAESVPDWQYGETFIRDDYFETYARELAEDIGAISPDAQWPLNHIDWEGAAQALLMDYSQYEYNGDTYHAR